VEEHRTFAESQTAALTRHVAFAHLGSGAAPRTAWEANVPGVLAAGRAHCIASTVAACQRGCDVLVLSGEWRHLHAACRALRSAGLATPALATGSALGTREAIALASGWLSGLLSPGTTAARFARAVQVVADGGLWITPDVRRCSPSGCTENSLRDLGLSRREIVVIRGVIDGLSSREIARREHLSASTVDTYRCRAMTKLGVSGLPELARLIAEMDLA